ncbi:MAG TPA: hypothetical protein VES64_04475 [Allosphingosinicella sp.]|nr:hypothetical protein [Allosphingosinicella sp.]
MTNAMIMMSAMDENGVKLGREAARIARVAPIVASERGGKAVVPEPRETRVAVARSGYRMRLHVLDPWQHDWLAALGHGGAEANEAAALAARASGREAGALLADLVWIPAASAAGLVVPD